MRRIKLTVAYDGTGYCGFQVQPESPTIEGELNKHLSLLLGEPIKVIGASRTDAGVHAYGNVAVFDTESTIPGEKFAYALNQRLPEDIKVVESKEVAQDFHPRHCDTRKTYEYHITLGEFPLPTKRLYSFFTYHSLDLSLMQQGAAYLVGEHDFKSFCSVKTTVESTVRRIESIEVTGTKQEIVIVITGNGFLYNMVRIIAGTLMEVGMGKRAPEEVKSILEARDRCKAGPTAPPQGLLLQRIQYLDEK